uniref:Uncharacterized protein n=1 Tax=Salmo trutta TaxID=8032 RepID=A0A674AWF8_SALTR
DLDTGNVCPTVSSCGHGWQSMLIFSYGCLVMFTCGNAVVILCRRCCDPLQPPESSAARPAHHAAATPEVHTYINMTILKGIALEQRFPSQSSNTSQLVEKKTLGRISNQPGQRS